MEKEGRSTQIVNRDIRHSGANSDLLTAETQAEMARRHPGMIAATVPDRGHVPFLDEPEALAAIHQLLEQIR